MPKLDENAQLFAGWPVDQSFISKLPDRDTMIASATSEYFDLTQGDYIKGGFSNFSNLTMKAIYEITSRWGIEELRIPGLEDLSINLSSLEGLPPSEIVIKLASEITRAILDEIFGAIGAVPVAGWILDIVWQVADLIWTFVAAVRELDYVPPGSAVEYSKDTDEFTTNRVVDYASSDDWTKVFLPMRAPDGFKRESVVYENSSLEAWHVYPYGGEDLDGHAVMPGYPTVFIDFQIVKYHKRPRTPLPSDPKPHDVGDGPGMNMGSLVPSTQQLGLSMWSMIRKNDANAFKIDSDKIELGWQDWFLALIDYIEWTLDASDPPDQKAQVANWLARFASIGYYKNDVIDLDADSGLRDNDAFRSFFEDRFGSPGFMFPAFKYWPDAVDKNAPNTPITDLYFVSWLPAIKFFLRDYRTAIIEEFSKTITIAYVGQDFPALKNPAIKRNWKEYRALLLNHSARANVELDLIPDQDYRNAMAQAQSKPLLDITAPPPPPGSLDIVAVPYIEPQYPTPPPPPTDPASSVRRRRLSRTQAALIATMSAGVAAWKGPELIQMIGRAIRRR